MSKKKRGIGTGVGKGHGTNTVNFPIIREVDPAGFIPIMASEMSQTAQLRTFKMGKVKIILTQSNDEGSILSVSCRDRYPTWDEVAHVRYELLPNEITMVMVLPPKEDYINIHNYCFILREIDPIKFK